MSRFAPYIHEVMDRIHAMPFCEIRDYCDDFLRHKAGSRSGGPLQRYHERKLMGHQKFSAWLPAIVAEKMEREAKESFYSEEDAP